MVAWRLASALTNGYRYPCLPPPGSTHQHLIQTTLRNLHLRLLETPLLARLPVGNADGFTVISTPSAASVLSSIAAAIANRATATEMDALAASLVQASVLVRLGASALLALISIPYTRGSGRKTYDFADMRYSIALGNFNPHGQAGDIGGRTRDGCKCEDDKVGLHNGCCAARYLRLISEGIIKHRQYGGMLSSYSMRICRYLVRDLCPFVSDPLPKVLYISCVAHEISLRRRTWTTEPPVSKAWIYG